MEMLSFMRYTTAGSKYIILVLYIGLLQNNMDLGILAIILWKYNFSVKRIIIIKSYSSLLLMMTLVLYCYTSKFSRGYLNAK